MAATYKTPSADPDNRADERGAGALCPAPALHAESCDSRHSAHPVATPEAAANRRNASLESPTSHAVHS